MTNFYVRAVYIPFLFISYLIFWLSRSFLRLHLRQAEGFPKAKEKPGQDPYDGTFFPTMSAMKLFSLRHCVQRTTFQKHSRQPILCQGWGSISDAFQKPGIQTSPYSLVKKSLLKTKNYCFIANFFLVGYKPEEPNNAQQTMYYTLWEMKDKEKRGAEEVRDFCCHNPFVVDKFLSLIISNDLNISLPHVTKANSNLVSHSRNRGNIISVPEGEEPRNLSELYVKY